MLNRSGRQRRRKQFFLEECLHQDAAHLPRAQHRDPFLRQIHNHFVSRNKPRGEHSCPLAAPTLYQLREFSPTAIPTTSPPSRSQPAQSQSMLSPPARAHCRNAACSCSAKTENHPPTPPSV